MATNETVSPHYVAQINDNVNFTCNDTEPIRWLNPSTDFPLLWTSAFAYDSIPTTQIFLEYPELIDGKYEITNDYNKITKQYTTTLELYNVDHESVGFYKCLKNSTKDLEWDIFNQIGISTHLFVRNAYPIVKIRHPIWIWDNCDIMIPCKSTSNDTNVNLARNGTQVNHYL